MSSASVLKPLSYIIRLCWQLVSQLLVTFLILIIYTPLHGSTVLEGPWTPHIQEVSQGISIFGKTDWTSDQPKDKRTPQHVETRGQNIHAFSGIQTHGPSVRMIMARGSDRADRTDRRSASPHPPKPLSAESAEQHHCGRARRQIGAGPASASCCSMEFEECGQTASVESSNGYRTQQSSSCTAVL